MSAQKIRLIKGQKESKKAGSKRGNIAELDGYLFIGTNSAETLALGTRHYWKCLNCPARLTTTSNDQVASVGTHICEKSAKDVGFFKKFN